MRMLTKVTIEKKKGKKESANSKLLALLFENRKDIKDGAYKRLCDELKKKEAEEEQTYDIDFTLTKFFTYSDEGGRYESVATYRYTTRLSLRAFLVNICHVNETSANDIVDGADDGISQNTFNWCDVAEEFDESVVNVKKVITIVRVQEV